MNPWSVCSWGTSVGRRQRSYLFLFDWSFEDFVDESVGFGFFAGEVVIALGVFGDAFDGLFGVVGEDFVEELSGCEDIFGLDFDIGDLSADLSVGLVDHHFGVFEGEAFAWGPAGDEDRAAAGGESDAVGGDIAFDELHDVVDGEGCGDGTAWGVDVEVDILVPIFGLQEEHFHDDEVSAAIVDGAIEEDDAVIEEEVTDGHLALCGVFACGHGHIVEPRVLHLATFLWSVAGQKKQALRNGTRAC